MRAIITLLLLFASLISGRYLLVETDSSEKVNYRQISLMLNCLIFLQIEYNLVSKGSKPDQDT